MIGGAKLAAGNDNIAVFNLPLFNPPISFIRFHGMKATIINSRSPATYNYIQVLRYLKRIEFINEEGKQTCEHIGIRDTFPTFYE